MQNTEGTLIATCGNDRKVTTWNLSRWEKVKELSLDGWVKTVVFSRDSLTLAAAGATANIHLWDLPSYSERHALPCDVTTHAATLLVCTTRALYATDGTLAAAVANDSWGASTLSVQVRVTQRSG